jgi:hypothetical protein
VKSLRIALINAYAASSSHDWSTILVCRRRHPFYDAWHDSDSVGSGKLNRD